MGVRVRVRVRASVRVRGKGRVGVISCMIVCAIPYTKASR